MQWQANPIDDDGEYPKADADGDLIVFLRNSVPEIIAMAEEAARLRAHCEAMSKPLESFAKAARVHKNEAGCREIMIPCIVAGLRRAQVISAYRGEKGA